MGRKPRRSQRRSWLLLHPTLLQLKHHTRNTMWGVTQAWNFWVGDYVQNHTRTSGLDLFYHGPYEVLTVDELTVTVRLERHGELTVHKNNVRPSQPAGGGGVWGGSGWRRSGRLSGGSHWATRSSLTSWTSWTYPSPTRNPITTSLEESEVTLSPSSDKSKLWMAPILLWDDVIRRF